MSFIFTLYFREIVGRKQSNFDRFYSRNIRFAFSIFFDNVKSFLNVRVNFTTINIPNFLKGSMFKAQKASAV